MNQLHTRRDDFLLVLARFPRVLKLICACRPRLLDSIPLITFSLFSIWNPKRTESINNSISASFMEVSSLAMETDPTSFPSEGKNPK